MELVARNARLALYDGGREQDARAPERDDWHTAEHGKPARKCPSLHGSPDAERGRRDEKGREERREKPASERNRHRLALSDLDRRSSAQQKRGRGTNLSREPAGQADARPLHLWQGAFGHYPCQKRPCAEGEGIPAEHSRIQRLYRGNGALFRHAQGALQLVRLQDSDRSGRHRGHPPAAARRQADRRGNAALALAGEAHAELGHAVQRRGCRLCLYEWRNGPKTRRHAACYAENRRKTARNLAHDGRSGLCEDDSDGHGLQDFHRRKNIGGHFVGSRLCAVAPACQRHHRCRQRPESDARGAGSGVQEFRSSGVQESGVRSSGYAPHSTLHTPHWRPHPHPHHHRG